MNFNYNFHSWRQRSHGSGGVAGEELNKANTRPQIISARHICTCMCIKINFYEHFITIYCLWECTFCLLNSLLSVRFKKANEWRAEISPHPSSLPPTTIFPWWSAIDLTTHSCAAMQIDSLRQFNSDISQCKLCFHQLLWHQSTQFSLKCGKEVKWGKKVHCTCEWGFHPAKFCSL